MRCVAYRMLLVWVLFVSLAAGCSKEGDTILAGVRLPGSFPGNAASNNNHALDGQALSENDESVVSGPRVFHSSRGNRAIILYTTIDSGAAGTFSLWATYFDGKSVTPPTEIVTVSSAGKQGDFRAPIDTDSAIVMFYESAGAPGNRFPSRDGDAVILFSRQDVDESGPMLPNDANVRLWWCYFDRSLSGKAAEAHGFGTFDVDVFRPGLADIVDSDDGVNNDTNQTTPFDNKEPDSVEAFGVTSDGLHGEAVFAGGFSFYQQTDFTEFLVATWTQVDEVNVGPTNDVEDYHLWWARFDFDIGGNGVPGFTTPQRIATDLTSPENGGGMFSEPETIVLGLILSYENSIVYITGEFPDPDIVLQYNHFIGDLSSGAFLTNSVEVGPLNNPTDGTTSFVDIFTGVIPALYGPDHNLSEVVLIFAHNEDTATDDDTDLFIARFDPLASTGFGAFDPATDLVQADLTGINPATSQSVFFYESRISRDSDYILVLFLQLDTMGIPELKGFRFLTAEPDGLTPPVNIRSSVGMVLDVSDPSVLAASFGFAFQGELGGPFIPPREGGARGVRRSAVQSDNNRMHVIYQLNDDGLGTPVDLLHVAQFERPDTLSDGTFTSSPMDDFPNNSADESAEISEVVRMLDDGLGGVVIYYVRDENFKVPGTLDPYLRLNGRHYNGVVMSSPLDLNSPGLQMDGLNFGAITQGLRDPAGNFHLLYIAEDRFATSGGSPASSVASRFRRFDKLEPMDTFGINRFRPIRTVDTGQSVDSQVIAGTSAGGAGDLAIYILQGGHLYYNEYSAGSDSWKDAADFIVDNDSNADAVAAIISAFRPYTPPDFGYSGETAGALAFWFRSDLDGDFRLHLRIHK